MQLLIYTDHDLFMTAIKAYNIKGSEIFIGTVVSREQYASKVNPDETPQCLGLLTGPVGC